MLRHAARWMASRHGLTPSIRTRLIVVVCVCLAPVAALVLRSAMGQRDLLVVKAGEQLVTSATLHAAKVDHLIDRTAVMLHAVRETGPVRGADPVACRETLRRVVADVGFVNGLGVSDTRGDKFCHTNATSPVNLADRPFFQAALRGTLAVGSVVMARTNGKPILPMALPVFDAAGQTWRVLTTGIPIATVEAAVGGAPLPRGADLTITDARGGVVVSTMPALAFGAMAPWAGLTRDDTGTVAWEGRLLGFATAHGGDLEVVISQPRAEFLAVSDRLFARELGLTVVVVLMAALLAAIVAELAFARRLRTLAGVAAGLAGGDLSARAHLPGGGGDEIGRLAHAVNDMAGSLEVTINDLAAREAAARHDAMHDPLTQLPNRLLLRDRLGEVLLRCRRYGERAAVLYIDLDRFKEVNDSLGHAAGDILLATCAERLKACARATDTVARLGGDEFAVLQTDVEHDGDVRNFCERIAAALAEPFSLDGQEFVVGASVGIALVPDDGEDPGLLMRNADIALYRAKADGRGRACFFKVGMDEQIRRRKALEGDLRHALAAGQLEVHYQPQVEAGSAAITGVEALLRWRHPERGMVPPVEFIPVAEETGLIIPIGDWVLRTACADAARWPGLRMSVNVSPVQFRQRDLVTSVERSLDDAGLPPDRLELEITEGVLMQSTTEAVRILERLKRLGVQIAMDDFGTGYSSLSYLQKFPFDKIKIDRSFVGGLRRRPQNRAIIRAVVGISQSFGMITCAEGVETADDLAALREEGCEQAQGYLFGRPAPATAIDALLQAGAAARIDPAGGRATALALPAPGSRFEGALAS